MGGGEELFWGDAHPIEGVLVLAQQGKSPRCQLWGLGGLHGSNAQLKELSPHRENDGHRYVLPPGGLGVGLRGKVVLLHPWIEGGGTQPPPQ